MPAVESMFCQATAANDGSECHSLSPGGGMILPSSNQEEIVKGFLSELTFWGDLPLAEASEKRDDSMGEQVLRRAGSISSIGSSELNRSLKQTPPPPKVLGPIWRTAVDPHSGRTYYYDAVSRRTQWDKPEEIRRLERQRRQEKKAEDRAFFLEMENNIRAALEAGELVSGFTGDSPRTIAAPLLDEQEMGYPNNHHKPARIRTISGMDQVMVEALKERVPKPATTTQVQRPLRDAHGRPPLPSGRARSFGITSSGSSSSLELSPEDSRPPKPSLRAFTTDESAESLRGEALLDCLMDDGPLEQDVKLDTKPGLSRPQSLQNHMRRNTGGTIFVKSTMMNPNIEATIKCVCGVYRTHILDFAAQRSSRSPISIIGCYNEPSNEMSAAFQDIPFGDTEVPSQADVILFYKDFYQRSQMEHDTIIMSLIYVERLIKATAGAIAPVPENWRSILFSCMVLASKVWDDLSMWNIDFSNVCGRDRTQLSSFTLGRINKLELALLKSLNFNVKVPASEYAKYYFLIRGMLMKSGVLNEQDALNFKGAKKLENLTTNYQDAAKTAANQVVGHRVSKSLDDFQWLYPNEDENGPLHTADFLQHMVSMKG